MKNEKNLGCIRRNCDFGGGRGRGSLKLETVQQYNDCVRILRTILSNFRHIDISLVHVRGRRGGGGVHSRAASRI